MTTMSLRRIKRDISLLPIFDKVTYTLSTAVLLTGIGMSIHGNIQKHQYTPSPSVQRYLQQDERVTRDTLTLRGQTVREELSEKSHHESLMGFGLAIAGIGLAGILLTPSLSKNVDRWRYRNVPMAPGASSFHSQSTP